MAKTQFNTAILSNMPTLAEVYRPFLWLTNGHVETIWAALFRRGANVRYYRRCLSMSDGGVVSLDFESPQKVNCCICATRSTVCKSTAR